MSKTLNFEGSKHFRQRIVCSILTQKRIKIEKIRETEDSPGITDAEANFLRLIDKITNGSSIFINETGTVVKFKPGILQGGSGIYHECSNDRSIGYILEALICLAPFGKKDLNITLVGITNGPFDLSVDLISRVTIPLLKTFGISDMKLEIKKRGPSPLGGGQVIFRCAVVKELTSINLTEISQVRRIRGIMYTHKVTPQIATRCITSAKSVLMNFTQDIFIYSDHYSGSVEQSPGYGLTLVAETNSGSAFSADFQADGISIPEDVGEKCGKSLISEISKGGNIDTFHQIFCFLFMTLSEESISKIRVGKLSEFSVEFLRILRIFFGVTFKLETSDVEGEEGVLCTVRGLGMKNLGKRIY